MRNCIMMIVAMAALTVAAADFQHGLSGTKPWTGENFLDDPQEFHFAIVADRTGGARHDVFERAVDTLNLLRPEFVMSVGDLIPGGTASKPELSRQWTEMSNIISKLEMPFFHVVGNHDIWTGITGMTPERQLSMDMWKERCGTNTYYSFNYKECLFVCLDSMEEHDYYPPRKPIPAHQLDWAVAEIEKHADVRWRFIFLHKPLDFTSDVWLDFERRIAKYDFTVFCGDWHNHCTAIRNGKEYHMIGTTGGNFDDNVAEGDLRFGILDAITLVTMTKKGPVIAKIALSGVHGGVIQTSATTQGWIEAPLDYPSHLSENPLRYANEKNTALIPTEVMHGPGFDWHFRHAVILRQGQMFKKGLNRFSPGKKRVILVGDETASAYAFRFGDGWQVFDFGFKGDRLENVLWRVIEGELKGYDPQKIVISVGKGNRGVNTPDEIAAGLRKLEGYVRERAPKADIELVQPGTDDTASRKVE